MPPKKTKKIIKKRKINKADVKRIPKYPNIKPNINLSPYDLATLVQQKFKQDMEADQNRIEKRQAELAAEQKVFQSPEYKSMVEENARLRRTVQLQQRKNQDEQLRVELDADATVLRSPDYHNGVVAVKQLSRQTDIVRRQNDALESREEEKARFEARRADAKGELEVLDQKRIQKERDKVAKATAKARVQSEHADELLVATKQQQKNLRTQAYIDTLQEEGPKLRKAEGEALAKVELENQRLEAEVGLTRNQQKLLLEHSVAVKELEQQKADVIQLLKDIRKDDPDSRITGDPALLEVDLQQLGEEQERFKSIHRQAAEARAIQYAILSQCKEVEDLKQQIQSSPYGMSFSSLYGNESNAVRAVGNLIQLRQGRAALTDKMEEIFPAVAQVQREQERKFEQIARERQELEAQKAQFEVEKVEMQNRLQDANAIIRTQEQQLALYQEASV